MSWKKPEKKSKKKFNAHKKIVTDLENTRVIKRFLMFEPLLDRNGGWTRLIYKLKAEWDTYYKKCRDSLEGKVFEESKDAWIAGDFKTVKGNAEIARHEISTNTSGIKKPSGIDPIEVANSPVIQQYKISRQIINDYRGELSEAELARDILT